MLKWADGFFMAACSYLTVRRVVKGHGLNMLDVHFGYPDGYAGWLLGRWLQLPVLLTLRGKEERQGRQGVGGPLRRAVVGAQRRICVSSALRDVALRMGANPSATTVIGNGVDLAKFHREDRGIARRKLGLPPDARIIISVGTLIERKGFHRVIACMPQLLTRCPDLLFLIVGGAASEGDMTQRLRAQIGAAGLERHVRMLGPVAPSELRWPLSAADVFVLATSYEGWANVFLEAMACGLPVITTDVGGNSEVVSSELVGTIVPYGQHAQLTRAIGAALDKSWNRDAIQEHAASCTWEVRVPALLGEYEELLDEWLQGGTQRDTTRPAIADEERFVA